MSLEQQKSAKKRHRKVTPEEVRAAFQELGNAMVALNSNYLRERFHGEAHRVLDLSSSGVEIHRVTFGPMSSDATYRAVERAERLRALQIDTEPEPTLDLVEKPETDVLVARLTGMILGRLQAFLGSVRAVFN